MRLVLLLLALVLVQTVVCSTPYASSERFVEESEGSHSHEELQTELSNSLKNIEEDDEEEDDEYTTEYSSQELIDASEEAFNATSGPPLLPTSTLVANETEPEPRVLSSEEDELLSTTSEPDVDETSLASHTLTTSEEDDVLTRSLVHQNGLNHNHLRKLDEEYRNRTKVSSTLPPTTEEPLATIMTMSTPAVRTVPSTKQSRVYRSKAADILRKFVENEYLRKPLACVVDTTNETLRKSDILLRASLRPNAPLDMILAGYNASGAGAIYPFKNSRTLHTGLNNLRESPRTPGISKAFSATLETAELIPYDSAIFLCTDQMASDGIFYDRAATLLIKKRIRFYLIWFGWVPPNENETVLAKTGGRLGDLALSTGGEILHIPNISKDEDLGVVTLFARRGINDVPYDISDSTVSTFYTPKPLQEPQSVTENASNEIEVFQEPIFLSDLKREAQLNVDQDSVELLDRTFGGNETETSLRQARQSIERWTLIEPSINSQLLVNPGSQVRIIFDVTNMADQISFHNFQVTGERAWLINFGPRSAYISPKQTIQVTILAQVPQNAEIGTTDKVTLLSQSLTQVSQGAYVRVLATGALQDPHRPYLHYTYGARCDGKKDPGTCSSGYWSLEVTTSDWQTGIMRLESEPKGLIIRSPYVAGTKDDVRATYTASCCQPRVTVTSYDVARNPSTFTVDVRDIWLSPAGIAAVVLGVFVGVLLLILIILGIVWCCTRNRRSKELPVYRGDSRLSSRQSRR